MKISAPLPTNTLSSIHTSETCSVAPTTYGEKVYLCHPSEDVHKWSMGSNKESPTTFGVNYADPHDKTDATLPDKTDGPPKNVPKQNTKTTLKKSVTSPVHPSTHAARGVIHHPTGAVPYGPLIPSSGVPCPLMVGPTSSATRVRCGEWAPTLRSAGWLVASGTTSSPTDTVAATSV